MAMDPSGAPEVRENTESEAVEARPVTESEVGKNVCRVVLDGLSKAIYDL